MKPKKLKKLVERLEKVTDRLGRRPALNEMGKRVLFTNYEDGNVFFDGLIDIGEGSGDILTHQDGVNGHPI